MSDWRAGRPWRRLVALTLDTYGRSCWLRWDEGCTRIATSADHVIPRSRGGLDELDNLRPSCLHCNFARQDRPLSARPAIMSHDGRGFFDGELARTPRAPRSVFFRTRKQFGGIGGVKNGPK